MLKQLPGVGLALLLCLLAPASAMAAAPDAPANSKNRVSALYTTWDDYYFYAGIEVNDPHVVATNTTPTSQPQQDDDVELFFETDNARADRRTAHTYQMAVSAANGSYFSVGDGGKIPKAKAIFTYKYAATVQGTLNDNSDTDTGYIVELAIPWQELGRTGPPHDGETWGFNAISRDRDSTTHPGDRFFSLAPDVKDAADVQDPAHWSRIVFDAGSQADTASTAERIVCTRVTLDRFPSINGEITSGEWPSATRFAFGRTAIDADAPTVAEEPNTTDSPFGELPPPTVTPPPDTTPQTPTPPTKPTRTASGQYPNSIQLPGGLGSIKVIPGGSEIRLVPPPMVPTEKPGQEASVPVGPGERLPGGRVNPLSPKPGKHFKPSVSPVSLVGSLQLGPVKPPSLVMALYRIDYNGDGRKAPSQNVWNAAGGSLLVDQPINGSGPWFTGLRPLWHKQQFADLRRAGIDVALIRARIDDPLLGQELDAMVEALKEMKARGQDYPLIGVDLSAGNAPLAAIYSHIPAEFRATVTLAAGQASGLVVYTGKETAPATLADGTPLALISSDSAAIVSPGRVDPSGAVGRQGGQTYADSWQKAMATSPQFVVIDSWNDFSHGTEICASRQYGERYADDTRLFSNTFNGSREWHAKYLSAVVPTTIHPRTLYTIPVRIENAGTLPWRSREQYALCPRWYKDGRLFDDSAPRVPVGDDVLPGQSRTLDVGIVAINGYGDDLEPGQYTLVLDMVQGDDRWFSYANDVPLQIPVTVVANADTIKPQATFLGTATTTMGQAGATYHADVAVRNDGSGVWTKERLAYKIQTVDPDSGDVQTVGESAGETVSPFPIQPGQIAQPSSPVTLTDTHGKPLPVGEYRLHWFIKSSGSDPIPGSYDETVRVVASDPGPNFVLSDIPRQVDAGKDETAQIAVQNVGPTTWLKKSVSIGYHWYYLDGREALWDSAGSTPIQKDVVTDAIAGNVTVKFHAPDRPGRYALVFDLRSADGTWASVASSSKGDDILPVLVTVDGRGPVTTVDLSKYVTTNGIAGPDKVGDFDGQGHALPAESLPPDGTSEVDTNPLLSGKPGPPLYPSGYYAAMTGSGWDSNHDVAFLYPIPHESAANVVVCQGQTLDLPDGNYKAVHLLMAGTSGQTVTASFGLRTGGQTVAQSLSVTDWTQIPKGPGVTPAFRSPYRIGKSGVEPTQCVLGDYVLTPGPQDKVTGLVLPNDPSLKILAVSLER
jgi:hypothetical protein